MIDYDAILWDSTEADAITGGRSSMPWSAYSICLKERDIQPGDLFFASRGDDLDFICACNAAAAVVPLGMDVPQHVAESLPIMRVPCPFEALRCLAKASRFRTHSLVVSVQGFEQRRSFTRALEAAADVYEGDRHLSSSVAAMPEQCDFSIFGTSPSLRPDVLIIDKCSQTKDYGVLDAMPDNGILILNIDDPAALQLLGRAKAAGLRNILTYGTSASADASLTGQIVASDGVQMQCSILGEGVEMHARSNMCPHMPSLVQNPNMLLASLLLAKLSDIKIKYVANDMAEFYMSPYSMAEPEDNANIQLFNAPSLKRRAQKKHDEAIFKVKNVVDVGSGSRTLILDQGAPEAKEADFTLPARLNSLDVVCASKKISIFKNARLAAESMFKSTSLQDIVPDVLAPGDYVVFKSHPGAFSAVFSEALRLQS